MALGTCSYVKICFVLCNINAVRGDFYWLKVLYRRKVKEHEHSLHRPYVENDSTFALARSCWSEIRQ